MANMIRIVQVNMDQIAANHELLAQRTTEGKIDIELIKEQY